MEGTKELGLGLIFTARFNEVSAAIDGLKAKLAELSAGFKGVGSPAAAETKKLEDAAKKAAKGLDDAAKGADTFKRAVASSMGESAQYQKALGALGKEAGTSQIRFKDLTGALRAAESAILQTAKTQFTSKQAAEEWASKVDRVKVAHAFMRDEMIRVDKQVLSAGKGTKELVRIQDDLRRSFESIGMPANVLIGQLGNQIKTLPELKNRLNDLSKAWTYNNSATVAATKVINDHANIMNQLGQNGDKWAAGVNKSAVAQAFLRGEVVKANGELISYGKSSQQITSEMNKLTKGFSDSDTRVKSLVSSFGSGIKTFDDFKAAIKSLNDADNAKAKSSKAVLDAQNSLKKSYPELATSVNYLSEKIKAGNISFAQAGDALSKLKIRQIENNKAMEASAKASAVLSEQKDNLARKYKALGPVADGIISKYGTEIKSIKDVTAALDGAVDRMNKKAVANAKEAEGTAKMAQTHGKAKDALAMLNKQVDAGVITQKRADELFTKYNKTVSEHEKEAAKAAKGSKDLTNSLTNAANGANKAKDYFQQLGYAVKQLAAWMPAALIIAAVTSAFTSGVQAVIEYDQALKNLQAITQATDAETTMMGEKILEVSKITKYSATEISAAMTTIGQAGFNAAQTIDIITPAAQLAQGALEKMDVTADLVTTTLTVFGLQSHEAARAADVLAAAANWSKANLQQLRTAMNYVGPVAKSAGISLEETAAAMMQLFNVGLKASTVGTSFRQLIGAIEAPNAKLRKAMSDVGMSIEELNPKFERTKGVAQGFGGSLEVLSKVLKGDLQKSLHLFGIRVAGTALALSNLGEDGFKLLVEQAGTVGSATKMAEIQMGGLQVSMKNTANVAKNLAITIGLPLGEAFKMFLNITKGVLEVMTTVMQTPFIRETAAWLGITTMLIGLGIAVKTLNTYLFSATGLVMKYLQVWAPSIAMWVAQEVAIRSGTAALIGQTAATTGFGSALASARALLSAFYMTLLANPWVAVATGIAAVIVGVLAYNTAMSNSLQASEKMYYEHQKNADTLSFYSAELKNAEGSELSHKTSLERLIQTYPELQAQLAKTDGSLKAQNAVIDEHIKKEKELAQTGLKDYFQRLANEYNSTKKESETLVEATKFINREMTFLNEVVFSAKHPWEALKVSLRQYLSILPNVDSANKVLGERITKNKELTKEQEAAFIKIGVTIGKNGQSLKEYAEKSGIALGDLTKRFPTLQKVIEATIRAQDRLKNAGIGSKEAQETADILGTMGDEWVDMYAKADNAQKAFILDTAQGYAKQQDALVKALESKTITRSQFDQRMLEAERQALEKVEKYQEDHYKKIEGIVDTAFKNKQKAIADSYAREREIAENAMKQELALLASKGVKEEDILKRRVELEGNLAKLVTARIKDEESAQLELNTKKEALLKSFAEKASNSADVQKRLLAKVNQEKLADDIATYTKSYESYKQQMEKKIGEVEKWAAKVKATQQEIDNIHRSAADKIESLEDKIRETRRKGLNEYSQTQDQINQVAEKSAKYQQALAEMKSATDSDTYNKALEKAKKYSDDMVSLASSVSIKREQIDKDGNRSMIEDTQATINYQTSILQKGVEQQKEIEADAASFKQKQLAEQKAMLQQSVDAMNEVSKSVTELGETLAGLNKKKIEVDTENVLLQIKKLSKDISDVEMKLLISFAEATTKEPIDSAVNKVNESIDKLKNKVQEQTYDLKVSIVDEESGEELRSVIDKTNEKINKFGEDINGKKSSLLITFEGEGSAVLPLSEKIAEMAAKFEEFKKKIAESSGYGVVVNFQGQVQDGPVPLTDAINSVQAQITSLLELANSSKPVVTLDITPAMTVLQELMAKIQELVKDWVFTVKANVYGKDDVDALRQSIDRLKDKTVTITTNYVSKGQGPTGYNKGGEIPGVGNTDTHPAILTPGEFVVRKSAVQKYGSHFFHMLNNMVSPIPSMLGSVMSSFKMPQVSVPALASAGTGQELANMGTLNLQIGNESFPVQAPINVLNQLNTTLRRMKKAGVQ